VLKTQKKTDFWMVFLLQTWGSFSWYLWALKSSLHRSQSWKLGGSFINQYNGVLFQSPM